MDSRKTPSRNSEEFHSMRAIPGRSVVRQDSAVPVPMGSDSPAKFPSQIPVKKMATPSRNSEEFHSMRTIPGRSVVRQDTAVPFDNSPSMASSAFKSKKPTLSSSMTTPSKSIVKPGATRTVTVRTVTGLNSSPAPSLETTFGTLNTSQSFRSPSPSRSKRQSSPSPTREFSPLPIRSRAPSPNGTILLTPSERRCACCSQLASQLDEFHRKPSPKKVTPPVSRPPSPAPIPVIVRDPSPAPASADRRRVVSAPTPGTIPGQAGLPPFSPARASLRDSQRDWDDHTFSDTYISMNAANATHPSSMPKVEAEGTPDMTVTGASISLASRSPTLAAFSFDENEPERHTFTVRRNYEDHSKASAEDAQSPNRYHNGSAARAERHRASPSPTVRSLDNSFQSIQLSNARPNTTATTTATNYPVRTNTNTNDTADVPDSGPVHAPPPRPIIPYEPLLPARRRSEDFASPEKGVWVPSSPLQGTSFNRTGCPYLTRCRTPSPSPAKAQLSIIVDTPAKIVKSVVTSEPAPVVRPYIDSRESDSISVATPSSKPARKSAPNEHSTSTESSVHSVQQPVPVEYTPAKVVVPDAPLVPVTPIVGADIDVASKVQPHGNIQLLNLSQQAPSHAQYVTQGVYGAIPQVQTQVPHVQYAQAPSPVQYVQQPVEQVQQTPQPPPVVPPVQYQAPPQAVYLQHQAPPVQPQPQVQHIQYVQQQHVPQTPQPPVQYIAQQPQHYVHHPSTGTIHSSGNSVQSAHSVVYSTPLTTQVFSPLTQTPSVSQYASQAQPQSREPLTPIHFHNPVHPTHAPAQYVSQYVHAPSPAVQLQYQHQHLHQAGHGSVVHHTAPPHPYGGAPPQHHSSALPQHYPPPNGSAGYGYPLSTVHYTMPPPLYPVQYPPQGVQYVQQAPQYVYPPHAIDTWYTDINR